MSGVLTSTASSVQSTTQTGWIQYILYMHFQIHTIYAFLIHTISAFSIHTTYAFTYYICIFIYHICIFTYYIYIFNTYYICIYILLAIFYPVSQFCEMYSSLLSLQKQPETASDLQGSKRLTALQPDLKSRMKELQQKARRSLFRGG